MVGDQHADRVDFAETLAVVGEGSGPGLVGDLAGSQSFWIGGPDDFGAVCKAGEDAGVEPGDPAAADQPNAVFFHNYKGSKKVRFWLKFSIAIISSPLQRTRVAWSRQVNVSSRTGKAKSKRSQRLTAGVAKQR